MTADKQNYNFKIKPILITHKVLLLIMFNYLVKK